MIGNDIGDLGPRLGDVDAERTPARRVDPHPRPFESKVRVDRFDRRPAVGVGERHTPCLRRHDELAALSVHEGKLREISRKLEPRIGTHAGRERCAQPAPCRFVDHARQVRMDVPRIDPRNLCGDVDFAGPLRAGSIGPRCAARRIRVGEFELLDANRGPAFAALPFGHALQARERDRRFEDSRQREHRAVARHADLAAVVRDGEAARDAGDAGELVLRRDAEVPELPARRVRSRRFHRSFPAQPPVGEGSARRKPREIAAQLGRERKVRGDGDERFELQPVELHLSGRSGRLVAHRQLEIRRIEPFAALRRERERLREELPSGGRGAPADASRQMREIELRKLVAQLCVDVAQLEIGDDLARLAVSELEPDAHRALPARNLLGQRQPLPPCSDVRVVEAHEHPALASLPVAKRHVLQIAAHVDRRGKSRRRRSPQSEAVPAEAVFHPELHAVQNELRGVAQVVVPGDQRIAYHDLALLHDPVGERRFAVGLRGIEFHARNLQMTGSVAADRKPRPLDDELLQPQLEQRHRGPRNDEPHFRQIDERQRVRARALEHPEALHEQLRVPAVPAGRQRGDLDRMPELPRERRGKRVAIRLDVRQDEEAKREERQREGTETDHDGGPENAGQREEERAGSAEEGARGRHN